ncbi:MAG TPA: hypothetical protein VKA74_12070 [Myxococcota bacterium]|nr:hypothetical protein [Myxococcota bacterium]
MAKYGMGKTRCSGGNKYAVKPAKMPKGGGPNAMSGRAPSMKGHKKGGPAGGSY